MWPSGSVCTCAGLVAPKGFALFQACCGPMLSGASPAASAQELMRSRYSAFVLGQVDYLLQTWHPSTRPAKLQLDPATKWLGLEVKAHRQTGENTAEVEFVARFKVGSRATRQHELSRFVFESGRWFYVDGDLR